MFDTIAGGSYGECPYAEIAEKLEKMSRNNKAWSIRKSDTRTKNFAVQSAHNLVADDLLEEMDQMITELGLLLKHVTGGAEKLNAVNYLSKPPPTMMNAIMRRIPMQEMCRRGVSDGVPKAQIRIIGAKVKGTKVGSMVTITVSVIMFDKDITTATKTST